MYNALVGPSRHKYASLRENLLKQLTKSPTTVSVSASCLSLGHKKPDNATNSNFSSTDGQVSNDNPTALFLFDTDPVSLSAAIKLDHVSFVSPAFRKFPCSRERDFIDSIIRINPDARVSAFRVGYVLGEEPKEALAATIVDRAYSVASQFLPTDYREISASHLALAMRLNYETCEPQYREGSGKVESITFADCMKIIGLEDRI